MRDNQKIMRDLVAIANSLRAANEDVNTERESLADGDSIDEGMIDGALHHAESAVDSLKRLRGYLNANESGPNMSNFQTRERRKANQEWEMAGLARADNDMKASAEHMRRARLWERGINPDSNEGKES